MYKKKWAFRILIIGFLLNSSVTLAEHFSGHVDVKVGALSASAQKGQLVFNRTCGSCHGENGEGTLKGPPMIHGIYNPGHHSNKSFYSAVRNGVKQHHWPYGDMPAQKGIGFSEMSAIVQFVREVQQQNGIVQKKHKM
ncbi:c-type cytochrome [Neptunomonas japonica]|uniref:Cytochrome c family protein n=1 Tax=Neptunomonas japonica JAMM 1380 TaxID=1441457 RepID=A0A7R6SV53_9GAMM|nr:cytochrome c [Neptunomonas japonica]BBB29041.1 cytochrome c family protein [Neptunomonas japonica JAMM 1380]